MSVDKAVKLLCRWKKSVIEQFFRSANGSFNGWCKHHRGGKLLFLLHNQASTNALNTAPPPSARAKKWILIFILRCSELAALNPMGRISLNYFTQNTCKKLFAIKISSHPTCRHLRINSWHLLLSRTVNEITKDRNEALEINLNRIHAIAVISS